ncbi:pre-rRNA processing [Stygiomarasmius scandens]|uniref:Pre-rRNA processing n=1 Tax=Marasmiellus scandens TaxID=2682957 RepID=A0ABR1J3A3_9AGAR
MPARESILMPLDGITMEDDLGIVYLVENAQQFWSELEDILTFPKDVIPTLEQLDMTLRRFTSLCAAYHELYLQSPLQLEHACGLALDSELFAFHSERMCEILTNDAQSNTNPHTQLICYHILLCHGRRRTDFFRSQKRWAPLIPLLMDHVLVEIDPDVEDSYFGVSGSSSGSYGGNGSVPVPIEAKLRSLGVRMLYEVCRVQKLNMHDLKVFDDSFIDYLFDLVEQTRHMQDETFNYSVIKLIVALNEQFMVASINGHDSPSHPNPPANGHGNGSDSKNRVLRVLMRRLHSSKTFGENMIFMLNRAQRTPEDLCMQLLVLKLLYLLFTTKGTEEYFYTNDLCVLVDVFLRELVDLDEDSESLRHTYLRVLHPLLTKTQLRSTPYKRPQILYALESLTRNSSIRDINPTTKRLVERCLSGEWCVQLKKEKAKKDMEREDNNSESSGSGGDHIGLKVGAGAASSHLIVPSAEFGKSGKSLKTSRSMEFSVSTSRPYPHPPSPGSTSSSPATGSIKTKPKSVNASASMLAGYAPRSPTSPYNPRHNLEPERRGSNASTTSYTGVAVASAPSSAHPELPSSSTAPLVSGLGNISLSPSTPAFSTSDLRAPKRQGTANSAHVDGTFAARPGHPGRRPSDDRRERIGTLGGTLDSTLIIPSAPVHSHPSQFSPTAMSISSHTSYTSASAQSMYSHSSATSATSASGASDQDKPKHRRTAPAPPVKQRRKPPAVPVRTGAATSVVGSTGHNGSGVVITPIKSSMTGYSGRS